MKKTNAIISINPKFVEQIMAGKKHFEYRKSFLEEIPEKCYIYSTKPVGKVVGFFTIKQVLTDNPEKIWELTHKKSGITKDFFDEYYSGKDKAVAIQIDRLFRFKKPKNYEDIDPTGKIPQSYKRI
ncbi:TPA: ASCH domain-containing protein [Streptococcus pyogenes]|uniref:Phage transcriptional regulator n=1 Tax=Streptococcus pyogenes TaxID=1314 RepID=A0A7G1JCW6_STRPY|nr:ASCH domain-containing protein [Streptococcus pyogenes]ESU93962.1 ASCH domain protein [Streptococcus pyogenes GA03747]HER4608085.1 ASCH domain-containing protein [Streptococcus pyogenes NGAS532]HER4682894.1 ASCH domain-containing protein [Streptococcus pyogenes NGAS358]HER4685607.1 ASCH domain-containing protein [Streptococcus pyogenes NGAS353]HER4687065.1 ASCH domain-containing protein [Streptococcus pyogenes NGAS364]HER4692883.1 ASCH domain-containing protein [Streptococcus pyogenes NGAS